MNQEQMFIDNLSDALEDIVNQLGGAKRVGLMLWPEKSMERAQRELLQCLDPTKQRYLSLEQIDMLIEEGRKKNIHSVAHYIGQRYGYDVRPVSSEQRKADAAERVERAVKAMEKALKDYERAG